MANPVVIIDYDPSWPATFEQLRARLAATLGPLAVAIEHVGSTAVPGLAAKSIIDLDVVIANRADLPAAISGYVPSTTTTKATSSSRPRSLNHPGRRTTPSPVRLRRRHSCAQPSSRLPRTSQNPLPSL